MLEFALKLACDVCGDTPTVRLGKQTLCRGCARIGALAAIEAASPAPVTRRERSDDETLAALASLVGTSKRYATLNELKLATKAPSKWLYEWVKRLEATGRAKRHPITGCTWKLAEAAL